MASQLLNSHIVTLFFATVVLIYVASLCFVIALFTRTLLRERSVSVDTTATHLERSPAHAAEKSSRAETRSAAKTA